MRLNNLVVFWRLFLGVFLSSIYILIIIVFIRRHIMDKDINIGGNFNHNVTINERKNIEEKRKRRKYV